MVLAVIAGILVGVASVVPFRFAMKRIRKVNPTHSLDLLAPFLLTIFVSFVVLVGGMLVCKLVAPSVAVAYSIAEILAFVVGVIVFGMVLSKRR